MKSPSCLALAVLALASTPASAQSPAPVKLRILAVNDFHGYLQPPPGGIRIADPADKAKKITVPAGGAEHMASLVRELRADHKNNIFVAAGDLIGASPFLSAMFHDEPTIEAMSMMGWSSRPSATMSSTRARTSCCACRTAAATPSTTALDRIPLPAQNSIILPPPPF